LLILHPDAILKECFKTRKEKKWILQYYAIEITLFLNAQDLANQLHNSNLEVCLCSYFHS